MKRRTLLKHLIVGVGTIGFLKNNTSIGDVNNTPNIIPTPDFPKKRISNFYLETTTNRIYKFYPERKVWVWHDIK